MPTYVYKNVTTGETFEIQQSIKDDALKVDPTTGDPVKRMIQPVGISFKGSGFYVNDTKANNPVAKAKPESSEASSEKSKASSETKTEAKSESKSETKSSAGASETKSATKKESTPSKTKKAS